MHARVRLCVFFHTWQKYVPRYSEDVCQRRPMDAPHMVLYVTPRDVPYQGRQDVER